MVSLAGLVQLDPATAPARGTSVWRSLAATSSRRRGLTPALAVTLHSSGAPFPGDCEGSRRVVLVGSFSSLIVTAAFPKSAAADVADQYVGEQKTGILQRAGKLGIILLIADVVVGVVLGKSALDIFNQERSNGGWKEQLADKILRSSSSNKNNTGFPVQKTPEEWKSELSREEFRILRLKGTEPPMTGEYNKDFPASGYFKCAACSAPLYSAQAKFDSGCGWPAFDKCYDGSVVTEIDTSLGMRRIEIMCGNCGGHLGHVFEGEGFTSTNERHCVNSVSISRAEKLRLAEKHPD